MKRNEGEKTIRNIEEGNISICPLEERRHVIRNNEIRAEGRETMACEESYA